METDVKHPIYLIYFLTFLYKTQMAIYCLLLVIFEAANTIIFPLQK